MHSSVPRILFLCHSASRNGATILLVSFLNWLKIHKDWDIQVIVNEQGPMLGELGLLFKTMVMKSPDKFLSLLPDKNWSRNFVRQLENSYIKVLLSKRKYDLIYANTGAIWPYIDVISRRAPKLLWHIHELGYALRITIGKERINKIFQLSTKFVAASNAVRDTLISEFKVPEKKVDVVHEFITYPNISLVEKQSTRRRVRNELNWPDDAFVVGGCGGIGWRKGTDLFLQIARIAIKVNGYKKLRFLWVGGEVQGTEIEKFYHDLRILGLEKYCCRVPVTSKVSDYYCAMDAFALTSREDPFPLVMLEAGAHGIPVVCFAESGGAPEFIGKDSGLISPYLDTLSFANNLMKLHDAPDTCKRLGRAALRKVQMKHNVETQAARLSRIIESCLEK